MTITSSEILHRAIVFSKEWENADDEKAQAQTFWNEFFEIWNISRRKVATFEAPVKTLKQTTGRIDLFWKG